ncbi:MAG: YihY/virulence factor BrkB family protein [Lentisphaeria bacterium]|nr:YihY/virulence factor BrkB family protein [Lentisphaeria bacterium]
MPDFKKSIKTVADIFIISGRRYISAQHAQRAVLLTYYTMFSIVPVAALLFGIAKGFALEQSLQDAINSRAQHNKEVLKYIYELAERTLSEASGGIIAGIGVIALLWTVIWLITNIERAFNAVWDLPSGRSWWRKLTNCLSLTLFTPFLMIITGAAGVMMRRGLHRLADRYELLNRLAIADTLAEIVTVLFICLLFTAVYRCAPNTRVYLKSAFFAALVAGIAFVVLQNSFLFLQKKVFSYNRIYGGFAALPLFLVWMNWSWQIVLFGAEISFVSQNIDNGVFENGKEKERSLRVCREHQLAVIRQIFCHFSEGKGELSELELMQMLKLPETMMKLEIAELLEKKIIRRTINEKQQPAYLPGVPPENFTVLNFLQMVNGKGDAETAEFSVFDRTFDQLEASVADSKYNLPIINIK